MAAKKKFTDSELEGIFEEYFNDFVGFIDNINDDQALSIINEIMAAGVLTPYQILEEMAGFEDSKDHIQDYINDYGQCDCESQGWEFFEEEDKK